MIWPTFNGPMHGIDRATGAIRWTIELPWSVMSSPVVIDDVLMQADATGIIHAHDLTATPTPTALWTVQLPADIESTPAMWNWDDGGVLSVQRCDPMWNRPRAFDPIRPPLRPGRM
ncbi:MAG: PQQ-binding-like beta-propeller repeat protein [Ilumatobacteraceae bacterium]